MERCPTCRARLKGATCCPRCQTDLNQVLKIGERAELLCQHAIQKLKDNDIKLAISLLKDSLLLQRNTGSLKVKQFITQLLEQRAVNFLQQGELNKAKETLKLLFLLNRTPIANALHDFICKKQLMETLGF